MDGGSGDESEGIGIEVEVDDSKEGMVIGDDCKDGTGAECEDTDTGTVKDLGGDYEVKPLAYNQ